MFDVLAGITIGVHLASVHVPAGNYSGVNPGLYVRLDQGLVAGGYRNSFGRASFYGGYNFTRGPFSLTLGAVTGYERSSEITTTCWTASPVLARNRDDVGQTRGQCVTDVRRRPMLVAPLIAPSVTLPVLGGIAPRITVLPKLVAHSATTVHFSLERTY